MSLPTLAFVDRSGRHANDRRIRLDVPVHHRSGSRARAVPKTHWSHKHRITTHKHAITDGRDMLLLTIVVCRNRSRADIGGHTYGDIAKIRNVAAFDTIRKFGILQL